MSSIFGLVSQFVGTLLFAGQLVSSSWAQDKAEPRAPRPPYPGGSEITLQWDQIDYLFRDNSRRKNRKRSRFVL
jgi:hypothetical protein